MLVSTLERKFIHTIDGQELALPDPGETLSPAEVQNFYSGTYAILTAAKIIGPEIKDDCITYRFESTMGTKG